MRILRLAGLATTLVAAGFLAAGCDLTVNYLNDGFSTDDRVTEVRLERGGSGDVEIRGDAAVTGIDVRRKVRYASTSAPAETAVVEGTRLTLDFDCGHNCSVSYVVRLPKGAAVSGATNSGDIMLAEVDTVDVKAGSGDIELTDVTGPATVSANSGNITVRGLVGELTVTTTSGDIRATDLAAATIRAEASSGNISLDVAGGTASARTNSGDIDVRVPDAACRVSADAGSGEVTIGVATATSGACQVEARAGSGNVSVQPL